MKKKLITSLLSLILLVGCELTPVTPNTNIASISIGINNRGITVSEAIEIANTLNDSVSKEKHLIRGTVKEIYSDYIIIGDEINTIEVYTFGMNENMYMGYEVLVEGNLQNISGLIRVVNFSLKAYDACQYKITIEENVGGIITSDKELYNWGEEVTLSVSENDGYYFSKLFIDEEEISLLENSTYKFIIEHDVAIAAEYIGQGIYVEEEEINVYNNSTYQIKYNVRSDDYDHNLINFSCENEKMATISNTGLITTYNVLGTTNIVITYNEFIKIIPLNIVENHVFDGKMNDYMWNDTVKTNKYSISNDYLNNEHRAKMDVYATRNYKGVYLFVDYYTSAIKNDGNNWWEHENVEIYFGNSTTHEIDIFNVDAVSGQCWASAIGKSNFDEYFISDIVTDNRIGLYYMTYELFMSYDTLGVSEEEMITFMIGSNPKAGWYCSYNFHIDDLESQMKITKDGILYVVDPCKDNHSYSEWTIIQEPTCVKDGIKTRFCKICATKEEGIINATGEHVLHTDNLVSTITSSTCHTHGTGKVRCSTCSGEFDCELPLDLNNHTGTYINGKHTCCGNTLETPLVNDLKASSYGWDNRSTWTDLGIDLVSNFTLRAQYSFKGGLGDSSAFNVWQHPLLVVTDSDATRIASGAAYGDNAAFRLDWWGWMDDRNGDGAKIADSQNVGTMFVESFESEMPSVIKGSDVTLTITRAGSDLVINYVITSHETGRTYYFAQGLSGLHTNELDISLSAEYSTFTVNHISII